MSKLPIVERLKELLAEAEQDRVDDKNAAEDTGERPDMWDYMVELTEDDVEEIATTITELVSALEKARAMLDRYRKETPLGNQPHMIAHKADDLLADIDALLSNTRGDTKNDKG